MKKGNTMMLKLKKEIHPLSETEQTSGMKRR